MRWPEYDEPICAGTNKRLVRKEALRILRAEHGTGPVERHEALCSAPIRNSDLREWTIPFLATAASFRRSGKCDDPDHDIINAERADCRGLREMWIKADNENQHLRAENARMREVLEQAPPPDFGARAEKDGSSHNHDDER